MKYLNSSEMKANLTQSLAVVLMFLTTLVSAQDVNDPPFGNSQLYFTELETGQFYMKNSDGRQVRIGSSSNAGVANTNDGFEIYFQSAINPTNPLQHPGGASIIANDVNAKNLLRLNAAGSGNSIFYTDLEIRGRLNVLNEGPQEMAVGTPQFKFGTNVHGLSITRFDGAGGINGDALTLHTGKFGSFVYRIPGDNGEMVTPFYVNHDGSAKLSGENANLIIDGDLTVTGDINGNPGGGTPIDWTPQPVNDPPKPQFKFGNDDHGLSVTAFGGPGSGEDIYGQAITLHSGDFGSFAYRLSTSGETPFYVNNDGSAKLSGDNANLTIDGDLTVAKSSNEKANVTIAGDLTVTGDINGNPASGTPIDWTPQEISQSSPQFKFGNEVHGLSVTAFGGPGSGEEIDGQAITLHSGDLGSFAYRLSTSGETPFYVNHDGAAKLSGENANLNIDGDLAVAGKLSGENGNLTVQGNLTVTGDINGNPGSGTPINWTPQSPTIVSPQFEFGNDVDGLSVTTFNGTGGVEGQAVTLHSGTDGSFVYRLSANDASGNPVTPFYVNNDGSAKFSGENANLTVEGKLQVAKSHQSKTSPHPQIDFGNEGLTHGISYTRFEDERKGDAITLHSGTGGSFVYRLSANDINGNPVTPFYVNYDGSAKLSGTNANLTIDGNLTVNGTINGQDGGGPTTSERLIVGDIPQNVGIDGFLDAALTVGGRVVITNGSTHSQLANADLAQEDEQNYTLHVEDGIMSEMFWVCHPCIWDGTNDDCPDTWGDYVFEPSYALSPLEEVKKYVEENKHLPGIPSSKEIMEGYEVHDMNKNFIVKIEELTLYTIQQEEKIKTLQAEKRREEEKFNALFDKVEMLSNELKALQTSNAKKQ